MKNYVVEATKENGYTLNLDDLNTYLGILILSSFNKRKSQKDFWSLDPLLCCDIVRSAMSRDTFLEIKSKIKYSKTSDEKKDDKAWRVRILLCLETCQFRKNIQKFGFFESALSVDEMMAKSYARTSLKQFIRGKPIRFGLKFWGLCSANGYLILICTVERDHK